MLMLSTPRHLYSPTNMLLPRVLTQDSVTSQRVVETAVKVAPNNGATWALSRQRMKNIEAIRRLRKGYVAVQTRRNRGPLSPNRHSRLALQSSAPIEGLQGHYVTCSMPNLFTGPAAPSKKTSVLGLRPQGVDLALLQTVSSSE